ncbi:MAG TPA: GDP-mannose 4,6-dehydratase [Acidobacteriota bacterium]|nr:GDP-mannose 4,6-dehydratase [Acidobacteriota bacterium]
MPAAEDCTKHYLITGGAGFIGSHLSEALLRRGDSVTVIDDLSTGRFQNIKHLVEEYGKGPQSRFRFAIDSITNETVLDRLASECHAVIHLAAAVGVRLILDEPVRSIETNVLGTEAVLKAALRYRAKILLASTSEVYGKGNSVPFREGDDVVIGSTMRSRWAYSASKMVDEFLALAYWRSKELPVVIFRLFNTVGPRQTGRYGMVIPRLIEQAIKGKPLTVYGDGSQTRCFLHVADAVAAILCLADSPEAIGGVFNVGGLEELSIQSLAEKILAKVGSKEEIIRIPYEEAYQAGFEDMRRRVPDISRLRQTVGWEPRRTLDDILTDTIRDVRRRLQG